MLTLASMCLVAVRLQLARQLEAIITDPALGGPPVMFPQFVEVRCCCSMSVVPRLVGLETTCHVPPVVEVRCFLAICCQRLLRSSACCTCTQAYALRLLPAVVPAACCRTGTGWQALLPCASHPAGLDQDCSGPAAASTGAVGGALCAAAAGAAAGEGAPRVEGWACGQLVQRCRQRLRMWQQQEHVQLGHIAAG